MSKNIVFRNFKPFNLDYNFHFYLLQFVGSFYMIYRLWSRDYSHLGLFVEEFRNYPRGLFHEIFPIPLSYFTTCQFIYEFIPFPSPYFIGIIQFSIIVSSIFVLIGVIPRIMSIFSFLLYLHLIGIMQSIDGEIDGGTLLIILFLILSMSPSDFFYKINSVDVKNKIPQWPIYLLLIFVGSFYSFAGLNKILNVGLSFPFTLDLEKWNLYATEISLLRSSRNYNLIMTSSDLILNEYISDFMGFIVLLTELLFFSIIFLPRHRFILVFTMITMHIIVYYTAAINFLGSSFILLLCFDWNIFLRKITVYYDGSCGFCKKSLSFIKKHDLFDKLNLIPSNTLKSNNTIGINTNRLNQEIGARDENGEIYYGSDAFEQIFFRTPVFWIVNLIYKVPGVIFVSRFIYSKVARNRHMLTKEGCEI